MSLTSSGEEAVELAASAGLFLDPWQQLVLDRALGERADGQWASFEVALLVPRQNGKGVILEARELAGLFLIEEERLLIHTAHEFRTAAEAFRRIVGLVTSTPDLMRRVKAIRTASGEEGIELRDGSRLRFLARSTGSGRGFSGDLVILDEAYHLTDDAMAALLPTLSARPNPQLWYTSSAGMESERSAVLRRVRERGTAGGDDHLTYLEWSAHPDADLDDVGVWAEANPALGIRIDAEFVERERAALPELEFARERLGIWDDGRHDSVIDPVVWARSEQTASQARDPVSFAVDVTPDRRHASIGMCGARADGRLHVEVVENRRGTGWVAGRVVELVAKWKPGAVVLDKGGPAASLLPELAEAGVVVVTEVGSREMAQACGAFFDDVVEDRVRHIGQPILAAALSAARRRPVGDAWAWHRKDATDISPLVAVTLARFGFVSSRKNVPAFVPRRIR